MSNEENKDVIEENKKAAETEVTQEEIVEQLEEDIEDDEVITEEDQQEEEKIEEEVDVEAELKAERDAALKRENDIESRYAKLHNPVLAARELGISNIGVYYNQHILHPKDKEAGLQKLKQLEKIDKKIHLDSVNADNKLKRKAELTAIDQLLMQALAEKEMGDDSKMKEYIKLRKSIMKKHPKVK